MEKLKRVFLISDFMDGKKMAFRTQSRMWAKGLVRAGYDVQTYSSRRYSEHFKSLSGKMFYRIMPKIARQHLDDLLISQIKWYQPDLVLILGMIYMDVNTINKIRQAAPFAMIVGRDEDPCPEKKVERIEIAKQMDMVVNSSAGQFLETYKKAGVPKCAFLPNICDPDIQYRYPVGKQWQCNLLFTGKRTHASLGQEGDRYHLIERISQMPDVRLYGNSGFPKVDGLDYFYAISGAKIALSVNYANNERLYHSDRLINYLACGAFVLSKRVPDTNLLFEDGKHLRYFDSEEEFFELADWYLKHDEERIKIARAGMEYAHEKYNCTKMANCFIDIVLNGACSEPWNVVL